MADDLITNPADDKVPAKKSRRWYELKYPEDGRDVFQEDMGNLIGISGILVRGKGLTVLVLSPAAAEDWAVGVEWLTTRQGVPNEAALQILRPSLVEWSEIVRQTDDPLVFERDATGATKAVHRKQRLAISGSVQQLVWVRDGLHCMYCGAKMGQSLMTIDHFMPLELGGINDETNYLTACSKCNKRKGDQDPLSYCINHDKDYTGLMGYLTGDIPMSGIIHLKGKV